jgi:acetyltransferase-like isoleucine patch superfamily enzyme
MSVEMTQPGCPQPAADMARARPVVPAQSPDRRFGPRALGRLAKRVVRALYPPRPGSEEWLKRNGMLSVGEHSYGRPRIHAYAGDTSRVTIGRWCSIASDVEIMPGGNHRTDTVTTYPIQRRLHARGMAPPGMPEPDGDVLSADVTIGNDVWIGRGARILGGVTIGDGAVIAGWAVVTRDVPAYAIAVGVPARVVRLRFPEETVQALLRIRWWDWPNEWVYERVAELASDDLEAFTSRYDPAAGA